MPVALREVEERALKLPARSRAHLAERLIASLEEVSDPEAEKLWIAEAQRRADQLASGKVKGVPASKVLKRARAAIR